jgi:hypothetical protein
LGDIGRDRRRRTSPKLVRAGYDAVNSSARVTGSRFSADDAGDVGVAAVAAVAADGVGPAGATGVADAETEDGGVFAGDVVGALAAGLAGAFGAVALRTGALRAGALGADFAADVRSCDVLDGWRKSTVT